MDWGFYSNLAFLLRGEVDLKEELGLLFREKRQVYRDLHALFQNPNNLYIFHSPRFTYQKFKAPCYKIRSSSEFPVKTI